MAEVEIKHNLTAAESIANFQREFGGKSDKVKHPSHYTYGKIEPINFILDKNLDFPLGNAIKYIVRAGHKESEGMSITDKAIEDLEKAKQYIDFEIEHLKGER